VKTVAYIELKGDGQQGTDLYVIGI
jgi:hypothetical protein